LNALLELDGKKRFHHPLASCIEYGKDKNGMATTVLRVPYWRRQEAPPTVELPDEITFERAGNGPTTVAPYGTNMLVTSDFTTTVLVSGNTVDVDSDFDEFSDGDAPISSCNSSSSSTASSNNHGSAVGGPGNVGAGASYSSGTR
jgi:hypothetical protein